MLRIRGGTDKNNMEDMKFNLRTFKDMLDIVDTVHMGEHMKHRSKLEN